MAKKIMLNLGCGNVGLGNESLKGFINVDLEGKKQKDFVKADVRDLPFPDNYADYILAREVLEHIPFLNIMNTLVEWVRVLKPGGRMVITSPNFNLMAHDFLNTKFSFKDFHSMARGFYGSQRSKYDIHLTPINPEFLNYLMQQLPVTGEIKSFAKGTRPPSYPGYKSQPDHVFRYGVVHVDAKKWEKQF